jgi:hypothetical protein
MKNRYNRINKQKDVQCDIQIINLNTFALDIDLQITVIIAYNIRFIA